MIHSDLTPEERAAVRSLQRLAKKWPPSLWIYCNGTMVVFKAGPDGQRLMNGESIDQTAAVATIDIPNDGGDY